MPLSIDHGESIDSCICIAAVRTVKLIAQLNMESPHSVKSFVYLDTHANNTVLGGGCLLIHDTGRRVDVLGFAAALGSIELLIVTGAIGYDHPITGKVYILVFHQAIYCHSMENHLICPMQCRVNGVVINDTPKFFAFVTRTTLRLTSRLMTKWT
jgi:hypothetical protein